MKLIFLSIKWFSLFSFAIFCLIIWLYIFNLSRTCFSFLVFIVLKLLFKFIILKFIDFYFCLIFEINRFKYSFFFLFINLLLIISNKFIPFSVIFDFLSVIFFNYWVCECNFYEHKFLKDHLKYWLFFLLEKLWILFAKKFDDLFFIFANWVIFFQQ